MQNLNDRRETFAISDHHARSYAAADFLGDENQDKISYQGKKGWFVARWQVLAAVVIIGVLLFVAVHIGRSSGHVHYEPHIRPHDDKHDHVEIAQVTPVQAPVISAHTNITTEGLSKFMTYLVEPLNYIIYIKPFFDANSTNVEKFTFAGNVSITLHVRDEIKYLSIGASDLRIASMTLNKIKNATDDAIHEVEENIRLSIDSYDVNEGTLNLELFQWLVPGQIYELMIEFNGDIHNLPYGLFRSYYADEDTGPRWLIGSNLEVPFARTVFPCFDAPTQTATFQLNIAHQRGLRVQSNSPLWRTIFDGDWIWTQYAKTEYKPVHSLAFVVNNFFPTVQQIPQISHFVVWTAKERTKQLQYVMDLAPKLIADLETYLGLAVPVKEINIYGLPQILPRQKSKIGMIYTSETDLIVEKDRTSEEHKEHVAHMLAGHLVEQWVENLIMFRWSSDDWMKDSLVKYLEYAMLRFAEPSWKSIEHFFVKVQQREMDKETANPNRQPSYKIQWKPQFDESQMQDLYPISDTTVFRRTSSNNASSLKKAEAFTNPNIYTQLYEKPKNDKGPCMIRMIKHIITEPLFVSALRIFLDNSRGKAVEAADLLRIMTFEARNTAYPGYQLLPEGISLNVVLEDWLYTEGYPLITVIRNYENKTISFSQYIRISENDSPSPVKRLSLWHIPVSYTTQNEKFFTATAPRFWLNKVRTVDIITPRDLTPSNWLLVNPQQTNFYRVNYDLRNWHLLKIALQNGEFPGIVRAQLIDDALFFARKGRLDYGFALDFTSSVVTYKEKEYIVWNTILRHLNYIRKNLGANVISSTPDSQADSLNALEKFKLYVRWLLTPPFNQLNYNWIESHNLDHNDKLLRSDMFLWACGVGISECNTSARSEFDKWKNSDTPDDEIPIEPDMRYAILCSIMWIGGSSDFQFLAQRYINTPYTSPEKRILLKSLYCYASDRNMEMLLADTLNQDYSVDYLHKIDMIWSTIPESFHGSSFPFNFMLEKWLAIKSRFSGFGITIVKTIVEAATYNLESEEQLEQLIQFKAENMEDFPYLGRTLDNAIRNLKDRLEWKNKQMEQLVGWLNKSVENGVFKLYEKIDELRQKVSNYN